MTPLLPNKIALVTGAGRGIGAATAALLAAHGATVFVNDLDEAPARATVEAIRAAGGSAHALVSDLTDPDAAPAMIEAVLSQGGTLDILVNNAGYTWDGMLHKMDDPQWEAMLAIHLTAPFRLIRAAAPYLRETAKREGSSIARKVINVSSTTGTRGNVGQANYAAGKAGIIGLTKTLAKEWGPLNIQVNAVAFGMIETRLTAAKEQGEQTTRGEREIALGIPTQMREMARFVIPMGRAGTPDEAAGPILFFASPLSNYVSGQVLEVTGGL